MTTIIIFMLWIIPFFGLRVSDYEERVGMDESQHGEDAYHFDFEPITKQVLYDGEDLGDDLFSLLYSRVKKRRPMKDSDTTTNDIQLSSVPSLTDGNLQTV